MSNVPRSIGGPLAYLRNVALEDLRSYLQFQSGHARSAESLEPTTRSGIASLGRADDQAAHERLIQDQDPSSRLAGILRSHETPRKNSELCIALVALALHDDVPLVRGAALHALMVSSNQETRTNVIEALSEDLASSFSIPGPPLSLRVAELWLDALEDMYVSVGQENARVECEDKLIAKYGGALAASFRDPSVAIAHLDSPYPEFQIAALIALDRIRNKPDYLVKKCEAILEETSHPELCVCATRTLTTVYKGTKNPRISARLARLVKDVSVPTLVRDVAYQSLFQINDLPVNQWPEVRRTIGNFTFPDDVDWLLIDRFMTPSMPF
jgi:hypothetical protein